MYATLGEHNEFQPLVRIEVVAEHDELLIAPDEDRLPINSHLSSACWSYSTNGTPVSMLDTQ